MTKHDVNHQYHVVFIYLVTMCDICAVGVKYLEPPEQPHRSLRGTLRGEVQGLLISPTHDA